MIWIVVFVVLMVIHLIERSKNWGKIAGLWLLILGLFIIVDGVQYNTGVETTETAQSVVVTYQYDDVALPYSTYSYIWGIIFILLGIWIFYANLE